MLYMVIERYAYGLRPVYERAATRGRMLPAGLRYVDSWIVDDERLDTCYQLMETDDPDLFETWLASWRDLGEFHVQRVISSAEAAARVSVAWHGGTGPAS
jgi:hypothetical protein